MLNLYFLNKNIYNFYILNFIKKKKKYYYNNYIFFGCLKWGKDFLYNYDDKKMFYSLKKILVPGGYSYRLQEHFYLLKIYFKNS